MAVKPLLDLTTLIVRPTIMVDGQTFELLSADELSVIAQHRMSIRGRRIEELSKSESEGDSAELSSLIDLVAREIIVGIPDEVFAKLTGAHRWGVVDVFTGLLVRSKLGVAGAMATAMGDLPTGARSFPGSSASTAGRRVGGLWTRLRGWFART